MKKLIVYILVLVSCVLFSCKSIPKENITTNSEFNLVDKSSNSEDISQVNTTEKESTKKTEEQLTTDEDTVTEETIKEYDTWKVDSGYVSVLKKETNKKTYSSKNQNSNKKEDISSSVKDKKESVINKNTNLNQDTSFKINTTHKTEASQNPKKWRYIFGILLIVFISAVFIYKKFLRNIINKWKSTKL